MLYTFLIETYATERLKVLSVWSQFHDEDLDVRPRRGDPRGRTPREHMVHQCVSEDLWFRTMFDLDVTAHALPAEESRAGFLRRYAEDSRKRLGALSRATVRWWEEEVRFFDVLRSRAWIMVRRIAHTAHHRGQQTALLRMFGREVYSTYGPTADTGGLLQHRAPTIYPYPDEATLLDDADGAAGIRRPLPAPGEREVTERP
jgi:uncharacterized damage-inducible protein DinB